MYFFHLLYLLLVGNGNGNGQSNKIQNSQFPSCKNCIYYRPSIFSNNYVSTFSKCTYFGTKDMITNNIEYDFVDSCRKNENQCGKEGKYYVKDKYINTKLGIYTLISNIPNISTISLILISYYNYISNRK